MNGKQITACILAGLILLGALVLIPWLFTPRSPEAEAGATERQVRDMMSNPALDPANNPSLLADSLLTSRSDLGGTNPGTLPLATQILETNLLRPAFPDKASEANYLVPGTGDPASQNKDPFFLPR